MLPTREDMSQTSHIGRESADSALEYRGWLRAGMVIKISRDARRQEAGEGERLEDVRVRIVSVSRLPALSSQLFVKAVGRFAQMAANGGCHINWWAKCQMGSVGRWRVLTSTTLC